MELSIKTRTNTYPIYLEQGCLTTIKERVNLNRKVVLITDENIPTKYIETIKAQCKECFVYTSTSGEDAKSLANYEKICSFMLEKHIGRKDLIIALGGGVIGDLSGFVASTYMRGIEFVNVPTTTLSQIDSSIGGKVAVNLGNTKNIVGAFYPPIAVFIDANTLQTLPKRHYYNGLVEALKAGLIYNEHLYELFKGNIENQLETIIYEALLVKKEVVEIDEFEEHLRKILNFGHTIGHGLESYYHLKDLLHGEAVALGMLQVIDDEALKNDLKEIYTRMNLKTSIKYNPNDVYEYIINDKKAKNNSISLITLEKVGKAEVKEVALSEIKHLLEVNNNG